MRFSYTFSVKKKKCLNFYTTVVFLSLFKTEGIGCQIFNLKSLGNSFWKSSNKDQASV